MLPRLKSATLAALVPVCAMGGAALAAGLGTTALIRRDKPLHTAGTTYAGRFEPDGASFGPSWLLTACSVTIRSSAAISAGLPRDIAGVAVRFPAASQGGGDADLLFASTGDSRWGRFVLRLVGQADEGPLTTLLPYVHEGRPFWLRLKPDGPLRWRLARSSGGAWTLCGVLIAEPSDADRPIRFDPIGHVPAGLAWPAWVVALRSPAYTAARTLAPLRGR